MANVSSSNSLGERIPKLRFPEFEGGWNSSPMGELGTFTRGAPLSKADIADNGTPFILYGELYTTYGDIATTIVHKTYKEVKPECYSVSGDVIIPTSGESPEEISTCTCVMKDGVILAGDLNIYRNNNVDGRFLSYEINHIRNREIAKIAQGKSIVHIKADELAKIIIHYPSKAEQSKIIKLFSYLDKKIEIQKELVKSLKLYKRGVIEALLSQKIELSESSEWKTVPLHYILRERKQYCEKDGTYEHATLSKHGILGKTERYDRDFLVLNHQKKYKISFKGDICYNPANLKFGVICMNSYGDVIISPIYITYEVNCNYNKKFVSYCLIRDNFIREALRFQQGTVYERMAVSSKDLLKMNILVPSMDTQNKIVKILHNIDKKINNLKLQCNASINLKKYLLQQMFI